jgi:predicted DNA-binding ribbon-helix-helix protein
MSNGEGDLFEARHQRCDGTGMRLTVRLDKDVYTVAMALARSEQISVAEAVNRLVRRGLERRTSAALGNRRKNAVCL